MRLYIAVLDEFPDHMTPTLVAHSVLGAHSLFIGVNPIDDILDKGVYKYPIYIDWFENSFKKVVVRVNKKEFDKISLLRDVYLGHENSTLDGRKSCAVVCPYGDDEILPNVLKYAKLWSPVVTTL